MNIEQSEEVIWLTIGVGGASVMAACCVRRLAVHKMGWPRPRYEWVYSYWRHGHGIVGNDVTSQIPKRRGRNELVGVVT